MNSHLTNIYRSAKDGFRDYHMDCIHFIVKNPNIFTKVLIEHQFTFYEYILEWEGWP